MAALSQACIKDTVPRLGHARFSTPFFHHLTVAMATSPRSCGMCSHCHTGIAFGKPYFYCIYCKLDFCAGCKSKHPSSHGEGLRRQVDKLLPENTSEKDWKNCSVCQKKSYGRVDCNACDLVICYGCFDGVCENLLGHEHKAFTLYHLYVRSGLWQYESECISCALGSTVLHCSRCNSGQYIYII